MITSTHNLVLSSMIWKVLHFLLSGINRPDRDFLYRVILSLVYSPEKPRDIAFIPSVLRRVQRWRVS